MRFLDAMSAMRADAFFTSMPKAPSGSACLLAAVQTESMLAEQFLGRAKGSGYRSASRVARVVAPPLKFRFRGGLWSDCLRVSGQEKRTFGDWRTWAAATEAMDGVGAL